MTSPKFFPSPAAFRQWLDANAGVRTELLVGFHKVATGRPSLSWSESVDEALCFGWIDGVRRRIDDATYSIRFTPRNPSSIWSAINIAKMDKLQKQGRMTPAGLQAFARRTEAKSMVYSHEQPEPAELPAADLAAFQREKAAWAFFESTPAGYKQRMLHWVSSAKKPETRAARLGKLIDASTAEMRLR